MASGTSPTAVTNYAPFLSRRSARRQPSALRALIPITRAPGMISLGSGFPNPALFPFSNLEFTLLDGSKFSLQGAALAEALQYGSSYGLPSLLAWLSRYIAAEHNPKGSDWDVLVTNGSQDGLAKAFDMLLNEGDILLTECPTYTGALSAAVATGAKIEGLESDAQGLLPAALEARMQAAGPKPRVVYIIPTGQNPAGSTMGNQRRSELYALIQKYDLLLLEDDPYWNLRFTDEPIRSFLSMDVDGRVIRLDSFSKIISSGFRIGWVTGPKYLVEKLQLDQQAGVIHPSGLSQAAISAVLHQWGDEGWKMQITRVREFYKKRRDLFVALATKHLEGLATWNVPSAGMFLWFQLTGIEDTAKLIGEKAVAKKVVLVPGMVFLPDRGKSSHVRASFSVAPEEDMDLALERLRSLLLAERQ